MTSLVIDGMGGDSAPSEIVKGVYKAAALHPDDRYILTGPVALLSMELDKIGDRLENVDIVNADQTIEMGEDPSRALRTKKDSSIVKGVRLVKDGQADAFISAGNTGATMAAALLTYGRIEGVHRPAIAIIVPHRTGKFLLLDAGATADCRPEHLVQFARMGSIYSQRVLGVDNPRVALLNIGEEKSKGNVLVKKAHSLLGEGSLNFTGNIEGQSMFEGNADVVVCDGFTGNVILKVVEGFAETTFGYIKKAVDDSIRAKIGGWFMMPVFKSLKKKVDYEEYGGAQLLGVNGVCIISHGSSHAKAIVSAIDVARRTVKANVIGETAKGMQADTFKG